jgi:hypothetical protein
MLAGRSIDWFAGPWRPGGHPANSTGCSVSNRSNRCRTADGLKPSRRAIVSECASPSVFMRIDGA